MMKRKNILSLFLLSAGCMLSLNTFAQKAYSLDECIEAALSNNVRMKMHKTISVWQNTANRRLSVNTSLQLVP